MAHGTRKPTKRTGFFHALPSSKGGKNPVLLGIAICLFLLYSTSLQDKLLGSIVVLVGIPIYVYFSPKVDLADLKRDFLSAPMVTRRYLEKTDRFLGRLLRLIRRITVRSTTSEP